MRVQYRDGMDATKIEDGDAILWRCIMYVPALDIGIFLVHDGVRTVDIYTSESPARKVTGHNGSDITADSIVRIIKSVNAEFSANNINTGIR